MQSPRGIAVYVSPVLWLALASCRPPQPVPRSFEYTIEAQKMRDGKPVSEAYAASA